MGYLLKTMFLLIFSPVLLYLFAPHVYEDSMFLLNAKFTEGSVVSINSVQPPTGRRWYLRPTITHITVTFKDQSDKEREFRGKIGLYGNNRAYKNDGKPVTVLYNKYNPKQAKIADLATYWIEGWGINFLIIGACTVVPINTTLLILKKFKR